MPLCLTVLTCLNFTLLRMLKKCQYCSPQCLNSIVLDGLDMSELHASAHAVKVQLQLCVLKVFVLIR
jgi:hypothetical protein